METVFPAEKLITSVHSYNIIGHRRISAVILCNQCNIKVKQRPKPLSHHLQNNAIS